MARGTDLDPNGAFEFVTSYPNVLLLPVAPDPDPAPAWPGRFFTVWSESSNTAPDTTAKVLGWSSDIPLTAIILHMRFNISGTESDAYFAFGSPQTSGGVLDTKANGATILSIDGCYQTARPTASVLTVAGRVVDANGRGISQARIWMVDGSTGASRVGTTNPFGYYSFGELEPNAVYVLNISHKRYRFSPAQRTLILTDSATGFDWIADAPMQ